MRTVTLKDLYQFRWPSNPKLSPDGQQVVYEKTLAREEKNDHETQLWLTDIDGDSPRAMTSKGSKNLGHVWSPNGKNIAYVSNRSGGNQLWVQSVASGEAQMMTQFHHGVSAIQYAPDGKTIYGLVPMAVDGEIEEWNETSEARKANNPSERTYDSLYYKFDGIGFNNGTRKQIVAINVETKAYKLLTDATHNIEEFSVSPDGESIVFSTIDFEDANPLFNGGIFKVSVSGGEVTKLSGQKKAASPAYSPNGEWVAFIGGDVHQNLYIVPAIGGETVCLSVDYQGTFADMIYTDARHYKAPWKPQWSNDSQYIFVLSGFQGTNEIVRFAVDQSEEPKTVIGGQRSVLNFSYDGESTVVVAYIAPSTPGRVSLMNIASNDAVVRTERKYTEELTENKVFFPKNEVYLDDCNADITSKIQVVEPETFSYESVDGWKIHGFMLKPANMEPDKKYPVVLDIHGGPHSTHGYAYFHQLQLYSAQGYAVVYVNPRGSSGYGETFTQAVLGEYGTKDMQDILNGVDAAIAKYDFLDESRVAVTGLSYGGFMTNWIVTHTDRFQVAITEGSISNWISMNGTSDIAPGFIDREFAGQTSFEYLWEVSPLKYIENVTTPTLVVHAEDDIRVPIEQAEQFYTYMKHQGKETRFVRIPESTHLLLQNGAPDKKEARLDAMLNWLNEHMPAK